MDIEELKTRLRKIVSDKQLESYTKPQLENEEQILNCLGVIVASFCGWDGSKIGEVFISALEYANYNAEAKKIREIMK